MPGGDCRGLHNPREGSEGRVGVWQHMMAGPECAPVGYFCLLTALNPLSCPGSATDQC